MSCCSLLFFLFLIFLSDSFFSYLKWAECTKKPRPDTRQSCCEWLGRSSNAKTPILEIFWTDGQTDRPTDTVSCRAACPRLKNNWLFMTFSPMFVCFWWSDQSMFCINIKHCLFSIQFRVSNSQQRCLGHWLDSRSLLKGEKMYEWLRIYFNSQTPACITFSLLSTAEKNWGEWNSVTLQPTLSIVWFIS